MSIDGIRKDMDYLAGHLPHRGANTEEELRAATYLKGRFAEYTPNVSLDEFAAIESHGVLFASYYLEFLVVALLALWRPPVAFGYGLVVFLSYLAEFTGYRVMSRLMPHYETQNVVARLMGLRPKRLLVVTAHYDSGKASALSEPSVVRWLRLAHFFVVISMVLVLATCISQSMGVFSGFEFPVDVAVRWVALAYLIFAAGTLFFSDVSGEFVRGAINNASGTSVLLRLAERFTAEPLEEADIMFVATGSKGSWMSGMSHFVKTHELDRATTYFLNLDHVGAGDLRYVTGEGMLHFFRSSKEMIGCAERVAGEYGATALKVRGMPTDGLIPLTRGYKALTICATGPRGEFLHWNTLSDKLSNVDFDVVERGAGLAESILRDLGRSRE